MIRKLYGIPSFQQLIEHVARLIGWFDHRIRSLAVFFVQKNKENSSWQWIYVNEWESEQTDGKQHKNCKSRISEWNEASMSVDEQVVKWSIGTEFWEDRRNKKENAGHVHAHGIYDL